MQCKSPISVKTSENPVTCGRCLGCKVGFRNEWASRVQMEQFWHYEQTGLMPSFMTLTYRDDKLPENDYGESTLRKKQLQNWIHNCRKNVGAFRFYACGEYGSRNTNRPHYHMVVFPEDALTPRALAAHWLERYGRAQNLPYRNGAAQYVSKYATKYLTHNRPDWRFREPEFRISSRSPPLGLRYGLSLLERLPPAQKALWLDKYGDVPTCYQFGGKLHPIGTYIRNKMRNQYGIPTNYQGRVDRCPGHAEYHQRMIDSIKSGDYETWEKRYAAVQTQITHRSRGDKF